MGTRLKQIESLPPDQQAAALNSLSDAELQAIAQPPSAANPLESLSNEQLMQIVSAKTPQEQQAILDDATRPDKSFGQSALETVGEVGEFFDKFTGAPTRAAIGELIPSRPRIQQPQAAGVPMDSRFLGTEVTEPPPFGAGGISGAVSKFGEQFGEDPALAPTGKQLAERLGVPEGPDIPIFGAVPGLGPFLNAALPKPNIQDLAGFGIDVLADPTNVIPISAGGKVLAKGAKGAIKGVGKLGVKGTISAAEGVVKAAKLERLEKTLNALTNPTISKDFAELSDIAKSVGIDPKTLPDQVEFGQQSIVGKLSRVQSETDLTGELADKFTKSLNNVQDAFDAKLSNVSGVPDQLDAKDAGELILDGYDKSFANLFSDSDVTYKKIAASQPAGFSINPKANEKLLKSLGDIAEEATQRLQTAITSTDKAQAQQILDTIGVVDNLAGDFQNTTRVLRNVGDAGFTAKGNLLEVPPDMKAMREIYGQIQEAVITTVKTDVKNGSKIADDLASNNKNISAFLKDRKPIEALLNDPKIAPETIFRRIVENGDTQQITALKNGLPPGEFNALKGAYVNSLVKRTTDGSNIISFRQTANALGNKRAKIRLKALLEPEELAEIADIIRLGDNHGQLILNNSKTAASNFFKDFSKNVTGFVTNDKVLDFLRGRARGTNLPPQRPAGFQLPDFSIPRQTPFDVGARAAQQTSIQQINEGR